MASIVDLSSSSRVSRTVDELPVIPADNAVPAFDSRRSPVARVQPGDTIRLRTSSRPAEAMFAAGRGWLNALDMSSINMLTGPVFIEGVEPGDAVVVEILEITPDSWGWVAAIPGMGLLGRMIQEPFLQRLKIEAGQVQISEALSVPVKPCIGCIGVAPPRGASSSLSPVYPWGGNYDLQQMRVGAVACFPAQVSGGLFYVGDLHASMGKAEPTSVALECSGTVTLQFSVAKKAQLKHPILCESNRVSFFGIGGSHGEASREAVESAFQALTERCGYSEEEAYALVCGAADLELGGPAGHLVLASLPLSHVAGVARFFGFE